MLAPGRTAPLESVTRPRISAVVTWACAALASSTHIAPRTARRSNVIASLSPCVTGNAAECNRLQMLPDHLRPRKGDRNQPPDVTGCRVVYDAPFMHATLDALQNSAFSAWVVGSDSIWAYPMILTMHTVGLGIVVGAAAIIDLRLLGVGAGIPVAEMRRVFPLFWLGFFINLVSGVMLFVSEAADKAAQPVF